MYHYYYVLLYNYMLRHYYIFRNKFWLYQGHTLFNRSHGRKIVFVKLVNGKQVRTNPRRMYDYSMDDAGWQKVADYPELFI